jgi:hypothetical protein
LNDADQLVFPKGRKVTEVEMHGAIQYYSAQVRELKRKLHNGEPVKLVLGQKEKILSALIREKNKRNWL